jgi:hypothetical protein
MVQGIRLYSWFFTILTLNLFFSKKKQIYLTVNQSNKPRTDVNLNKVAVVGDATWKEVLTKAVNILPNIDAKYFELDEKEKAQYWIGLI